MLEYYDCPSCLEMREELFECPSCTGRACPPCLTSFSKNDHNANPESKSKGMYKCTIC